MQKGEKFRLQADIAKALDPIYTSRIWTRKILSDLDRYADERVDLETLDQIIESLENQVGDLKSLRARIA